MKIPFGKCPVGLDQKSKNVMTIVEVKWFFKKTET
jgi:hypothetical protein